MICYIIKTPGNLVTLYIICRASLDFKTSFLRLVCTSSSFSILILNDLNRWRPSQYLTASSSSSTWSSSAGLSSMKHTDTRCQIIKLCSFICKRDFIAKRINELPDSGCFSFGYIIRIK